MSKLPGFGLVERARALQPLIASEADEIERSRRLTPKVTAALNTTAIHPMATYTVRPSSKKLAANGNAEEYT